RFGADIKLVGGAEVSLSGLVHAEEAIGIDDAIDEIMALVPGAGAQERRRRAVIVAAADPDIAQEVEKRAEIGRLEVGMRCEQAGRARDEVRLDARRGGHAK